MGSESSYSGICVVQLLVEGGNPEPLATAGNKIRRATNTAAHSKEYSDNDIIYNAWRSSAIDHIYCGQIF